MNKTVRIALAVISILVAVAVALSVVVGIDSAGRAGKNMAETEFDRFTNTLRGIKTLDELNDPFLRERLVALYKGSKPLLAAMIMDQAGQVIWRIPADTPYLSPDNTTFIGPRSSTASYSSQITGNINLSALYTTLPQTTIFNILRNALIFLGVYVAAVIVFIIIISMLKPETKAAPRSYEQPIVRPGPPTLRGEKPRPNVAAGGTPRVQSASASGGSGSSGGIQVKSRTNDLASSRLVSDVPLQTTQKMVVAMASQNSAGDDDQRSSISAPGLHDIEFPEMGNSADSKYRAMMANPTPVLSKQGMQPGIRVVTTGIETESRVGDHAYQRASAKDTAQALAEFEASYRGTDTGVKMPSSPGSGPSASVRIPAIQAANQTSPASDGLLNSMANPGSQPVPDGRNPGLSSMIQPRAFTTWDPSDQPAAGTSASQDSWNPRYSAGTSAFHETAPSPGSGTAESGLPSEYTLGLYSPISGLGWERNLPDRLETEIARTQADGGDVALLMVSFDGLTSKDPMHPAFTASIKDYFSIRDLAFECGPGGFALILPNIDVKRAVRLSEDLLKSLKQVISLYREPSSYLPLYMGISAVAGRSVPASRVVKEATAALQKARTDQDSHIVAFNPDPAKYKKHAEGYGTAKV